MLTIGNQTFALATEHDGARFDATGKTATDRKLSALIVAKQNSEAALVAMSYQTGKVGKAAREARAEVDNVRVVDTFARGDLLGLAATIGAILGETVKFAKTETRSAWESVAAFRSVIEHKFDQLESKGKVFGSKGTYTAAAAALKQADLLIAQVLARKDAIWAEQNAKRTALAAEMQAEKGAE
jgi:hypothetical protein